MGTVDKEIYGFYAMVFRQKYINRWSMMRNNTVETLSTHSMECAVLAHALALIGNTLFGKNYNPDRVAVLALYHDVPEVYTSDLPTPVKYYNEEMRKNYDLIENEAIERLMKGLPEELRDSYRSIFSDEDKESRFLVKAADKLCAYIKCINECNDHNSEFKAAKEACEKKVKEYSCQEVDYFLEYLLPAFSCTLDELG